MQDTNQLLKQIEVLSARNEELSDRLQEAQDLLAAIRNGQVDALVVIGQHGEQVYTLKNAHEPYKVMVENMNEGAATLSESGDVLYCNSRLAQLLKMPLESVIGQPLKKFLPPEALTRFDLDLEQSVSMPVRRRIDLRASDGQLVPIQCSTFPLKNEGPDCIAAVFTDLSEVLSANAARARLALIVASSDDAIFTTSPAGRVESWNSAAERLFGYTSADVIDVHIQNVFGPENEGELPEMLLHVSSGKNMPHREMMLVCKNKARICVSVSFFPIKDEFDKVVGAAAIARDLTSQKQAAQYARSLIETSLDPFIIVSRDGRITDVNEATTKVTGLSRGELLGSYFSSLFIEGDKADRGYNLAFEQGVVTDYPLSMKHRNGSIIDVVVNASVYKDVTGNVLGVFAAARDVTNLKKAQSELVENQTKLQERKKSEERLHTVLKALPTGIIILRKDGSIVMVNSESEKIFGYSQAEMTGRTLDMLAPPGVMESHPDYLHILLGGSHPRLVGLDGATYGMRKGGALVPVEVVVNKFHVDDSEFVVLCVLDITERKEAEDQLRSQAQLLDLAHDTIMVRDLDGTIRYWNRGAQEMYGYTDREAVGQKAQELLKSRFPEPFDDILQSLIATGRWDGEIWRTTADGRQLLVASRWALKTDAQGKTQVMAIDYDITERKRTEDLRRSRDLAVEASNLKTAFLSNVSHELRTPLAGILGMNELILNTGLTGEQHEYADAIESSAQKMLSLVNDLLDITRIEAGRLLLENKPFDPNDLIIRAIEVVAPATRSKNLHINLRGEALPSTLVGDARRVHQVLVNLLGNAVKFTESGAITIGGSVVLEEEDLISVKFLVSDTGIGIAEEERKHLFMPFSQVDSSSTRRYGGAGLGLTICKRLVELMGGDIGFESVKGKGSVFWFTVPFTNLSCATTAPKKIASPAKSRSETISANEKALIIEDDSVTQSMVKSQLELLGLAAEIVGTAEEGIDLLQNDSYCVVLMDCHLPKMDGLEATRVIRDREAHSGSHVPIIAMTAAAMRGDAEKCLAAGMDDYLSKPYSLEELRQKLASWLVTGKASHKTM